MNRRDLVRTRQFRRIRMRQTALYLRKTSYRSLMINKSSSQRFFTFFFFLSLSLSRRIWAFFFSTSAFQSPVIFAVSASRPELSLMLLNRFNKTGENSKCCFSKAKRIYPAAKKAYKLVQNIVICNHSACDAEYLFVSISRRRKAERLYAPTISARTAKTIRFRKAVFATLS